MGRTSLYRAIALFVCMTVSGAVFADELVNLRFRLLHLEVAARHDEEGNRIALNFGLHYWDGTEMKAVETDAWLPTGFLQYRGEPELGFFVRDRRAESGFREVGRLAIQESWGESVMFAWSASPEGSQYLFMPIVFSEEQRNMAGLHALNLGQQELQVSFGDQPPVKVGGRQYAYFDFPDNSEDRLRIQGAVLKDQGWKRVTSTKRLMDRDRTYFGIFYQPQPTRDTYRVRLMYLD